MIPFGLIVLALLGMPLFAVMAAAALAAAADQQLDPALVILEFLRIADMPELLALPFFTLAGVVLAESHTTGRLAWLGGKLLRPVPGAATIGLLLACTVAVALGGLAAGGLLAGAGLAVSRARAAGALQWINPGFLLAPAAVLIVLSLLSPEFSPAGRVAMDQVFAAALVPFLLALVLIAAWLAWYHRGRRPATGADPVCHSVSGSLFDLALPVVVVGSVLAGWLSVVEAGGLAAAWVVVSDCLVRREVAPARLPELAARAMVPCAAVIVLLGFALFTGNYLVDSGLPRALHGWLDGRLGGAGFVVLAACTIIALGSVLGLIAGLIILAPLLLPLALEFGVHPLQFGIVFVLALQVGGCIVHLATGTHDPSEGRPSDAPVSAAAGRPLIACLALVLAAVIAWPALATVIAG